MKLIPALITLILASTTHARDDREMFSIEEALNTGDAKAKLDRGIRFVFGDSGDAPAKTSHGEFVSNKKANGVGRSDQTACQRASGGARRSHVRSAAKRI